MTSALQPLGRLELDDNALLAVRAVGEQNDERMQIGRRFVMAHSFELALEPFGSEPKATRRGRSRPAG